jgi:hypothetical protein
VQQQHDCDSSNMVNAATLLPMSWPLLLVLLSAGKAC